MLSTCAGFFLEIMSDLIPVLNRDEIEKSKVAAAEKISSDYQGCERFLSGALKGAFIFQSDFVRLLNIPVKIDFLRAASYGSSCSISGKIQLKKDFEIDIKEKMDGPKNVATGPGC